MENQKNDNLNLLEAVVQNTEMGKNTLEQIVPMTDDVQFKAELLRQRNVYHQLNQEAHTAIEACGGTAQGQSAMAKLNTKMGISMKSDVYKRQQYEDPHGQVHPQSGRDAHTGQRHGGGGLRKGPEGLPQCRARRKAPCPKIAGVSGG